MKRPVLALFAAFLFATPFNVASAQEVSLNTIATLFDDTPMYSLPGYSEPTGVIAPQNVWIVGAEENWNSYQSITEKKWFEVKTWLGDQWIQLDLRELGSVSKFNTDVWLSGGSILLDSPVTDKNSELALSEQTVHATARFQNKIQAYLLVDTWAGPKWVPYGEKTTFPVIKTEEQIKLSTATGKFNIPLPGYENGTLQPQTVSIFEKQGEWLHALTANGETVWVNKRFAEPEGATKTDESVEVSVVTPLEEYPLVPSNFYMGKIAPQTVTAFEKWVSPEGEPWYHIHSWVGDAWVRTTKGPYLTKEAAIDSVKKQVDPNGTAKWSAVFVSERQVEPSDEIRPVWIVTGVYPNGFKTTALMDAVTGKQYSMGDIEAGD